MQGTNLRIGHNLGFRGLLKDTLTLTLGEPAIRLGTLWFPSGCSAGHSIPELLPPHKVMGEIDSIPKANPDPHTKHSERK